VLRRIHGWLTRRSPINVRPSVTLISTVRARTPPLGTEPKATTDGVTVTDDRHGTARRIVGRMGRAAPARGVAGLCVGDRTRLRFTGSPMDSIGMVEVAHALLGANRLVDIGVILGSQAPIRRRHDLRLGSGSTWEGLVVIGLFSSRHHHSTGAKVRQDRQQENKARAATHKSSAKLVVNP